MTSKRETVDQIYKLLISLVEDDSPQEDTQTKKKTRRNTKKKTTKKPEVTTNQLAETSRNSNQRINKFDSMAEKNMFRDDIAIDRKLSVQPPCPRTRSYNTISVACRVCGKTETVNPSLVSETTRYKCNSCARSGG